MDISHLESLRRAEVDKVKEWFKPGMRVLEIGGGYGFQASIISSWGCMVTSIDVGKPLGSLSQRYPVQYYDGTKIPFPDHSFDIVFSSNVLEHIAQVESTLSEISRVLVPRGWAIHILPTPQWRLWTMLSHYPFLLKELIMMSRSSTHRSSQMAALSQGSHGSALTILKKVLFAEPHGEHGNALSELYTFSARRWTGLFLAHGFNLIRCSGNGLFYTGYAILPQLPMSIRRFLARIFGSSSRIYAMRCADS